MAKHIVTLEVKVGKHAIFAVCNKLFMLINSIINSQYNKIIVKNGHPPP